MRNRNAFKPSGLENGSENSISEFEMMLIDPPNADLNRQFYKVVGAAWSWTDRLSWSEREWQNYVNRAGHKTFVAQIKGVDVGYVELEIQESGNVEIVYLGLMPDTIGKGLGAALLTEAVKRAWDIPDTERVWLHTCTQDHHHALDNYKARGFEVFKVEEE